MAAKLFSIQRALNPKHEIRNSKQSQMTKFQMFETDKSLGILNFEHAAFEFVSDFGFFQLQKPVWFLLHQIRFYKFSPLC
jgi:hypothetical protein